MPAEDTSVTSKVRLEVPPDPRFLRLVRLATAGMAADAGFDVDALEDLRVAVDEACAALIGAAATGGLTIEFEIIEDGLRVEGRCGSAGVPVALHPVAAEVVSMLADEFELSDSPAGAGFVLVKRLQPTTV